MVRLNDRYKKTIWFIAIFFIVFIPYAIVARGWWYACDDLGTVLNGLIKSWKDFLRIFTDDMRNYSTPYNYNLSKSNIISGYYRPMQQVFYSMIHPFFGVEYYPYILQVIFFHAMNASLFFLFLTHFVPITYSVVGGLLLAFYPCMTWLKMICTLQHSLLLFFFLLALLCYIPLFKRKRVSFFKSPQYYLSGFFLLLSLLSREMLVFVAPWAFSGVFLLTTGGLNPPDGRFWQRVRIAFARTWVFFAANLVYLFLKFLAFGVKTLPRTINSVLIVFPALKKIIPSFLQQATVVAKAAPTATQAVQKTVATVAPVFHGRLFGLLKTVFQVPPTSSHLKMVLLFITVLFVIFMIIAYKKHKKVLLFFVLGIPVLGWSCVILAIGSRYFQPTYPLLIFMVLFGAFYFVREKRNPIVSVSGKIFFMFLGIWLLGNGIYTNIALRKGMRADMKNSSFYKFADFQKFSHGSHVIFLSTLACSDIAERFQVLANDFTLKVAHVDIVVLKHGLIKNYEGYKITPIQSGFRFAAIGKGSVPWEFWRRFPSRWNPEEHAYNIVADRFKEGQWYEFSMGKFFVHKMGDAYDVSDISLEFDKKFLTKNTFFVAFDKLKGHFFVLDSSHCRR